MRASGALLVLLTLSGALSNRGLFLARNEIERLFSAPVSRSDLVRYRLVANAFRSVLGGVLLGLFSMQRMPAPALAFAGIVLAMQTLPILNQLVAIALGGLEQRAARVLRRVGHVLLLVLLVALGTLVFVLSTDRDPAHVPLVGRWLESLVAPGADLFAHPVLTRLTLPLVPWAHMITAAGPGEFLPWFGLCLGLHVLLLETCARLPIDFRELSLATSVRMAAHLTRVRRGGGVASTPASAGAAAWRVPWLFGRGPAGAIAWRKSAGMVRKAKGALWVALLALLFITIFTDLMLEGADNPLLTSLVVVVLGTFYLCSGLRFDFREELERMDVIRTWPLAPAQVFLATLLPEVVLVSLLLGGTVLAQAALGGALQLLVLGIVACVPFVVFAWVALDNAVFLLAPVRFVPGQEGMLQNAGRGMILLFLRTILAALLLFFGGGAYFGAFQLALGSFGGSNQAAHAAGFAALFPVLLGCDALLAYLGGRVLARFDVARDRG